MKRKNKGFTVVEVALIVVLIAIVGLVGWRVLEARQNKEDKQTATTQPATENKIKPAACEGKDVEKVSEKAGISFCYPEGWKIEFSDEKVDTTFAYAWLTSPDYKEESSGYGGSKTGAKIYIGVGEQDTEAEWYQSTQEILDGAEPTKGTRTNVKAVKISGIDGVQFRYSWEGPIMLESVIEHDGKVYGISTYQDIDGPEFNDHLAEYQRILDSFRVLR